MQVRKLEEALGVGLVEQVGRQLILTEAGRTLLDYAQRIFRLADEAEEVIGEVRGMGRGRVQMGASSTPGVYLLPALLARYKQRYPGVEIALEVSNSRHVLNVLSKGEMDLGVVGDAPHEYPELRFELLVPDDLVLVLAPGHPLAQGSEPTMDDLQTVPMIQPPAGSGQRALFEQRLAAAGMTVHTAMELGNTEAIKQAVAAGLGVAVLSGFAVGWEVAAGRLVARRFPGGLRRNLFLASHRDRRVSGSAQAMMELLRFDAEPCSVVVSGRP